MFDLEVCISRRETIYSKVAAKDTRLKEKHETKQKFLKKLYDLQINIKKIKTVTILIVNYIIFKLNITLMDDYKMYLFI